MDACSIENAAKAACSIEMDWEDVFGPGEAAKQPVSDETVLIGWKVSMERELKSNLHIVRDAFCASRVLLLDGRVAFRDDED